MAFSISLKRPPAPRRNRPLADYEAEKQQKPMLGELRFGQGKVKIRGFVMAMVLGMLALILLGSVNRYQNNMPCKALIIEVDTTHDNAFARPANLRQYITSAWGRQLEGEKMGNIQLEELEATVEQNPYVKNAEVYKSIQGRLYVEAEMRKPIARVINEDGSQFYLDEAGEKFPTSELHAANVPLVRGSLVEQLAPIDSFECVTIETAIPVLKYIREQPFWNAMISDVYIRQDGELLLYPRLGEMYVEFGQPVRIAEKFENFRLFIEQVCKQQGWDAYKGVSLKYRGQVVGKRRGK
ncbi:MAG: hypothetical protein D6730_21100 [Bacteroidetes bacterium]|nr:MAG: hypothetical protein D6730_21100 [Bacteroidota bacterium]